MVVGIDGSPSSRRALRYAIDEAAARGCEVRVVAATEPVPGSEPLDTDAVERVRRSVATAARRMADDLWGTLPDELHTVPVWFDAHVGSAAAVLVDAARYADLLVVGRRGGSAAQPTVLGSTSLRCVLEAACPVTVVGPGETASMPDGPAGGPATPRARRVRVPLPVADAVERVRAALSAQGFGVLTEVDLRETLRAKLGVETRPHVLLGACRPGLAHRALAIDPSAGLLLPCTVAVRADDGDGTVVEVLDPEVMVELTGRAELGAVAAEAAARLDRAFEVLDLGCAAATPPAANPVPYP